MRIAEISRFHQLRQSIGSLSLSVCWLLLATPAFSQETAAVSQQTAEVSQQTAAFSQQTAAVSQQTAAFSQQTAGATSSRAEQSPRSDQLLRFQSVPKSAIREGYLALSWNDVAGAAAYEVREADDLSYYRGVASESFVSGLSDGTYDFQVSAIDGSGGIIATSDTVTVVVQHWPLRDAFGLFAVGLIVVMSVLVVIVRGAGRAGVQDGGRS